MLFVPKTQIFATVRQFEYAKPIAVLLPPRMLFVDVMQNQIGNHFHSVRMGVLDQIVEEAPVKTLFADAHHPYTEGLLAAMPRLGQARDRLRTIPGSVPPPTRWPSGCRFHDRCSYAWERCATEHPPLYQIGTAHVSRCHLAEEPERRAHPHEPLVMNAAGQAARA